MESSDKNNKDNTDFIKRANVVTVPIHNGHIVKKKNIWNIGYTWSPEIENDLIDLTVFHQLVIPTLHTYAYHGFFKPTIAEVLQVLPTKLIELVEKSGKVMYYTTKPLSYDINEVLIGNYHIGITTLYLDNSIEMSQLLEVDLLEKYKYDSKCTKFTDQGEFVADDKDRYNYMDYKSLLLIDKINQNKTISELLNEQTQCDTNDKYANKFFVKSVIEAEIYIFNKVCISNEEHVQKKKQRLY